MASQQRRAVRVWCGRGLGTMRNLGSLRSLLDHQPLRQRRDLLQSPLRDDRAQERDALPPIHRHDVDQQVGGHAVVRPQW